MKFIVIYHEEVKKDDISLLPRVIKERVKKAIMRKLTTEPGKFGRPLRRSLKGYRKLRVGDYRIVYRIEKKNIKIFAILHRSEVYPIVEKRI